MTYRDELAAAHAHNDILRRRIAELEASAGVAPSEQLVDLIERGRATRTRRHERATRAAERRRIAAGRAKARQRRAERASRKRRTRQTFGRLNITRNILLPPILAWGLVMFTIPLFILSGVYRMIAIPVVAIALTWPLTAMAADRLLNGDAAERETAWHAAQPFSSRGVLSLVDEAHVSSDVAAAVRFAGARPEPAMIADVLAGLGVRGALGEMLAQTRIRAIAGGLQLEPPEMPQTSRPHRRIRDWYRAIVSGLAALHPHFPVVAVELRP